MLRTVSASTSSPAPPPAGFGSLARNHDFSVLWIGQTVSDLGARASSFVFPILAFALTGSALAASVVEVLFLGGLALTLLPAGVMADRYHRGRLMRASAATGVLLYTSLAVAGWLGTLTLTHLLVVATITGLATGLFTPAETAAIRTVVTTEELPTALAQQQARQHIAGLLGAPLGGALYGLTRWLPFAANAVAYAVAWVLLGRIRADLTPAAYDAAERARPAAELAEGLRFIWRTPFLRLMLLWSPLVNLTGNALFFLAILRLLQARTAPGTIALVEVIAGIAGILGALIAPWLVARTRTGTLAIAVAWSAVPMAVPMSLWNTVPVLAAALGAIMVLNPAGNAALGAFRIAVTPEALLGRVQGAMQFTSWITIPLAPLLAGALLSLVGGLHAGLVLSALLGLTALVPTCSHAVRSVPRPHQWRSVGAEPNVSP